MERRKISREGKYIFLQRRQNTEKEKEDYIWRRKLHFCEGEGKGGKYLEKETIFFEEEKKNVEGKGKIFGEGKLLTGRDRDREEGGGGEGGGGVEGKYQG